MIELTECHKGYVSSRRNYNLGLSHKRKEKLNSVVVNGRFCPQSVRSFCPVVAGFNAGTYKVPACVL